MSGPYGNIGGGAQPNVIYPAGEYVQVGGGAAPQHHGIAVGGCYRPQTDTVIGQCGGIGDGVALNPPCNHSGGIGGGAAPNVLHYQGGELNAAQPIGGGVHPSAPAYYPQEHVAYPSGGPYSGGVPPAADPCCGQGHQGGIGSGAGPNVLHYQGENHGHHHGHY